MALGALIIENRKGLSDQEPVNEISETPYMQYFLGLPAFIQEPPFNASLAVHSRKRLRKNVINRVNEMIAKAYAKPKSDDNNTSSGEMHSKGSDTSTPTGDEQVSNAGRLILDATCVPAD